MTAFLWRISLLILAIVLIVAGLIVLPLPIPFGALILLVLGVSLLIASNDTAAGWIRAWRVRNPRLNSRMLSLEARLPVWISKILRRTTP
jgi:uncharacterized membrane protein HdeD (DUF308 family)